MTRIHRIAASAVVTALLGFMGAGVSAAPAVAACSGYSCHGLDPIAQGCSATSTTGNSGSLVAVQNRYSQGCNANWARAELTQQGYNNGDQFIVWIDTTDSHGNWEFMCYPGPSNTGQLVEACSGAKIHATGWWYTDMVDGTNVTHACVDLYDSGGNFIEERCADQ